MEPDFRTSQVPGDYAKVMTVGDWIVTSILMAIPIVNIIMLIVWISSANENPNRKNWAIATLIFMGIAIVLYVIFIVVFASMFGSLLSEFS